MKKFKTLIAVMVAAFTVFAFTACGGINASALVKSNLDLYKDGKVNDEILANIDMSEEELTTQYNEEFDDMMNQMTKTLDCDEYMDNGGREDVEKLMKAYLGAMKYEVAEEATKNDDGSYTVTVTAYPMNFVTKMNDYVNNDLVDEWTKKVTSGKYKVTTEKQLMVDMYSELFPKLTKMLDDVEYGDGQEVTVRVTANDDKVYTPNQADMSNVMLKCMGM